MRKILAKTYLEPEEYEALKRISKEGISEFLRGLVRKAIDGTETSNPVVQSRSSKAATRTRASVSTGVSELHSGLSGEAVCEHGITAYNCKKWGCPFYEVPNGRGS